MNTASNAPQIVASGEEPAGKPARAARTRASKAREVADAAVAAGSPPTNPLDRVIGYKLRRAQLVIFQEFIDYFARVKLRPAEYALIAVLERYPGLSQTRAGNMLGIKRANFVALLDQLERRGLAERTIVHGDRRSRALHLTEKGRRLAARAESIATDYDDMLVSRLGGPEARDGFLMMLDRLVARG